MSCLSQVATTTVTDRGRLGRLALARWAGWSGVQVGRHLNVEVGQTTYPVNRGRVGREGREGSDGQSQNEEREGGSRMGRGHRGLIIIEVRAILGY